MSAASSSPDPRRSIGRRDVTEWRSRAGRRLAAAQHRLASRGGRPLAVGATLAVGGATAAAGMWIATLLYDAVTGSDGVECLDRPALHRAMRLRNPATNAVAAGIARGFGPIGLPILTLGAGGALALRTRTALPVMTLVVAGAGSLLMTIGGKDVVDRHRPPHWDAIPPLERSPSFPSGHALNASAVVGTAAYLLMLDQRTGTAQLTTAAGPSRPSPRSGSAGCCSVRTG